MALGERRRVLDVLRRCDDELEIRIRRAREPCERIRLFACDRKIAGTLELRRHVPLVDRIRERRVGRDRAIRLDLDALPDRKSTRLNSSHLVISYAVFCLKKKKTKS